MSAKEDIMQVKEQIDRYIGSKVLIKSNQGRKKVVINEGVLHNTYPSIFVVSVRNEFQDTFRTISYSYTDILSKNVELSLAAEA